MEVAVQRFKIIASCDDATLKEFIDVMHPRNILLHLFRTNNLMPVLHATLDKLVDIAKADGSYTFLDHAEAYRLCGHGFDDTTLLGLLIQCERIPGNLSRILDLIHDPVYVHDFISHIFEVGSPSTELIMHMLKKLMTMKVSLDNITAHILEKYVGYDLAYRMFSRGMYEGGQYTNNNLFIDLFDKLPHKVKVELFRDTMFTHMLEKGKYDLFMQVNDSMCKTKSVPYIEIHADDLVVCINCDGIVNINEEPDIEAMRKEGIREKIIVRAVWTYRRSLIVQVLMRNLSGKSMRRVMKGVNVKYLPIIQSMSRRSVKKAGSY
jgi:hypothetical protein